MEENINLSQIEEVKYLVQENTPRYRMIIKYLFNKYEEAEYWLYKEEIYDSVKNIIEGYTEEECDRDLEFLLDNGSITKMQDTQNISTINDFKFHNYRYQLTDKAVIIERMTIDLEELEVKIAALEPRLFEKINETLKQLVNLYELDENDIYFLWTDLNNDFKNLNEHYQDFLKRFHEAKTEELLQSEAFLEFKSNVINYINNFIKSYIKNSTSIKETLTKFDDEMTKYMMDSLISHQMKAPKISPDFDFEKLRRVNIGKWQSILKWFMQINGKSEGERLLEATQNVIRKIYKYASSLIELHGNMINRKEEYKHICYLFDKLDDVSKAHELSGCVFGTMVSNHYKMSSLIDTDSLVKSYSVKPLEIPINTTNKDYKIKSGPSIVIDKSSEKEKILEEMKFDEKNRKEKIYNLIKNGKISLTNEIHLEELERRYILNLIENFNGKEVKETEFGYSYSISNVGKDICNIISPDGIFSLKEREILIEVGDNNGL